jgi:tRNA(fMet)-specific endonuclease VapC
LSYLVDTNICIALLKGEDKDLVRNFQERSPSEFHLCSIVKAELLYGAYKSQKVAANLEVLRKFFAQFHSVPFDDVAAEFYGTIRALLTKAGTPIGANDLLIASIARVNDLTILTRNPREFVRVPGLACETW